MRQQTYGSASEAGTRLLPVSCERVNSRRTTSSRIALSWLTAMRCECPAAPASSSARANHSWVMLNAGDDAIRSRMQQPPEQQQHLSAAALHAIATGAPHVWVYRQAVNCRTMMTHRRFHESIRQPSAVAATDGFATGRRQPEEDKTSKAPNIIAIRTFRRAAASPIASH